jgi:hypothetical protein
MSAQILQRIYALNIHLLTSRTKGFFITLPFLYLFHSNLLLVEALGTAPKSSLPFNLSHQTVSYLYHVGMCLSSPFFKFLYQFCMFLQQEQNQYVCLVQLFLLQKTPQYLFF